MTLKSYSLHLILAIFVAFFFFDVCTALGSRNGAPIGGWQPIKDPQDPKVREIGEFAVTEHNKEAKTDLKLDHVIKGETQVVSGTNYRLVIAAKDGAVSNNYEVVVWDKPWEHYRELISFKSV